MGNENGRSFFTRFLLEIAKVLLIAVIVTGVNMYGNYRLLEWRLNTLCLTLDKYEAALRVIAREVTENQLELVRQKGRDETIEERIENLKNAVQLILYNDYPRYYREWSRKEDKLDKKGGEN